MGAAQVLHKPISIDELRTAIHSVFFLHYPHSDLHHSAAFEAELQELTHQARAEILTRGRAILEWSGPANELVRNVHRLAGLAGQFGAPEVAVAADLLEVELSAGAKDPDSRNTLDHALKQFALARLPPPEAPNRVA
jgi:HPt (histidine-containing phosphotransfer) domain-containing protein